MAAPGLRTPPGRRAAFTLLELVTTLVILGIVAAIAIPRLGRAAENARAATLSGSRDQLQRAVELYCAEHAGVPPSLDPSGGAAGAKGLIRRLLSRTDETGALTVVGRCGPYIRAWPPNPINGLLALRIGGAAAGAGTHGWRFDPDTYALEPDHAPGQKATSIARPALTAEEIPD